jgi:hypothetical protein
MYSKFWENVRERLKDKKDGQKWLAKESGVGRTAINNGIAKLNKPEPQGREIKNSPSVDNSYAVAKALGVTIEELVAGKSGLEYVRQRIVETGEMWEPPPRLAEIMAILKGLDDDDLTVVTGALQGMVQGLVDTKRGDRQKDTGTEGMKT